MPENDKGGLKPNSPSKDADLHFAGYNKAIGMPVVAEIMNARGVHDAVDVVHEFVNILMRSKNSGRAWL